MQRKFEINNFDLLRLLAATQVLIIHATNHLDLSWSYWVVLLNRFPGVSVFFVISGYLISRSFEKNSGIKNYFRNRALRIYPGLWGCLIVTIITASIFGGINFINHQTIPWLVAQMIGGIYTPDMLENYGFGSYNGSLWTIPVEIQFYVLLPITYLVWGKQKKNKYFFTELLGLFFLIACFIKLYFPTMGTGDETQFEKLLRYSFVPHFWLFLTGVVLQRAKIYNSKLVYGKGLIWLGIYIFYVIMVPPTAILSIIEQIFLGITAIAIAYSYPSFSNKMFKGNDISYGVYIYHGTVLNVFVQLLFIGNLSYLWYVLLISFVLAFISWKLIEKPFIMKKLKTIHNVNQKG